MNFFEGDWSLQCADGDVGAVPRVYVNLPILFVSLSSISLVCVWGVRGLGMGAGVLNLLMLDDQLPEDLH